MGQEGAANYYKLLEAEKKEKIVLRPFAKHIAQTLFYLNYKWLKKHMKRGRVSVATLILNTCSEEPSKSRRDNITTYHVRREKFVGCLQRAWVRASCCTVVMPYALCMYSGDIPFVN